MATIFAECPDCGFHLAAVPDGFQCTGCDEPETLAESDVYLEYDETFSTKIDDNGVRVLIIVKSDAPPATRTYVVGLPVVVTVRSDRAVTVETVLEDLSEEIFASEEGLSDYGALAVEDDADLIERWARQYVVKTQGYVH